MISSKIIEMVLIKAISKTQNRKCLEVKDILFHVSTMKNIEVKELKEDDINHFTLNEDCWEIIKEMNIRCLKYIIAWSKNFEKPY